MASLYDRISKGTMSVDEITQSMVHATSEGGKFYQSMEKQSQTLNGQLSTLKDNVDTLMGSLTEGLSDDLRNELLPLANNMIGELQTAFETGGVGGLTDAATSMIPNLLEMMTGELEQGISAISKWLPQGASQIMKAVPTALRGASSVIPQITTALFEVATVVITDLTGMLPELIPTLVEGFASMLASTLRGVEGMISGLFTGIEQAFHQGQTKIAGVWVDNENIAKYDFDLDVGISTTDVKTQIKNAKTEIETALSGVEGINASEIAESIINGDVESALETALINSGVSEKDAQEVADSITSAQKIISDAVAGLGLSEEISAKIREMVASGATESELTAYLKSVGVEPGVAETTALTISTAGETVSAAIGDLPKGVQTALSGVDFTDDQAVLESALKLLEVSPANIASIMASYKTTSSMLSTGVQNMFGNIETALTDGLPDTEEVIGGLESDVRAWAQEAYAMIDGWYTSEVAALNESGKTGSEYDTALSEIVGKADSMRAGVQNAEVGAIGFLNSMAGQSTEYVRSHLDELYAIQEAAEAVSAEIDSVAQKAASVGQNAYNVVRSGAQADEATISKAISFKVTEFKIDEQSAIDAYNAAVEELNRQLSEGEITKEEYNTQKGDLEEEKNAAVQKAKEAYEQALREIFGGIAESEGVNQQMADLAQKVNLTQALNGLSAALAESGMFGSDKIGDQLGEDFTNMLANYLQISPEQLKGKTIDEIRGVLDGWAMDLQVETQEALKGIDNTKLQEAYGKALEDGVLKGTQFDATEGTDQLAALLGGLYSTAAEKAAPEAEAAGEALVESAETGGEGSKTAGLGNGNDYGSGYVEGIRSWANAAYSAAYSLTQSASAGAADGQDSSSPSKVAKGLGNDFGDGYSIGLRESMARAVAVARQLTGHIATSADITQTLRVANMPNLSQEIAVANEQVKTPVFLDSHKIAEIQGFNNSVQLARRDIRSSRGVGRK